MAIPISMLKLIHGAPLPWLVESFDRLLRLTDEPASKSRVLHPASVSPFVLGDHYF
jgi:hypothetical protein